MTISVKALKQGQSYKFHNKNVTAVFYLGKNKKTLKEKEIKIEYSP